MNWVKKLVQSEINKLGIKSIWEDLSRLQEPLSQEIQNIKRENEIMTREIERLVK